MIMNIEQEFEVDCLVPRIVILLKIVRVILELKQLDEHLNILLMQVMVVLVYDEYDLVHGQLDDDEDGFEVQQVGVDEPDEDQLGFGQLQIIQHDILLVVLLDELGYFEASII